MKQGKKKYKEEQEHRWEEGVLLFFYPLLSVCIQHSFSYTTLILAWIGLAQRSQDRSCLCHPEKKILYPLCPPPPCQRRHRRKMLSLWLKALSSFQQQGHVNSVNISVLIMTVCLLLYVRGDTVYDQAFPEAHRQLKRQNVWTHRDFCFVKMEENPKQNILLSKKNFRFNFKFKQFQCPL